MCIEMLNELAAVQLVAGFSFAEPSNSAYT